MTRSSLPPLASPATSKQTRRRGQLAALVALCVALSLALVATHAPLRAANTASEGALAADGSRTLAAGTRYGTAIRLAQNALSSDTARDDEVILASGESLVDSLAAVSLARSREAVVLLTPTGELASSVERFIDETGFTTVTLMGGTSAVSADIEYELVRSRLFDAVDRVWGSDRYETAVVAARAGGAAGQYCDTVEPAAFLVNGEPSASQPLIDGVVVAPFAYAAAMPVLLTRRAELPPAVAAYVTDESIGRVVVVGSDDAIDPAVVAQLTELGVVVTRIDGESAAARSVALAEAIADCGGSPRLAPNRYALLSADEPVDGVTAAAALAGGLGDDDGVIPTLAVGLSEGVQPSGAQDDVGLPGAVANYLASTPTAVGPVPAHVTLYALGGIGRITPELMEAAIDAAVTSAPLTAAITAVVGSNVVRISFSDDVDAESALDRTIYTVAGTGLLPPDRVTWDRSSRSVVITLDAAGDFQLMEGDEIAIAPNRIRGSQTSGRLDRRTVAATTYVIPVTEPDDERPRLEVLAAQGASVVRVIVDEANPGASSVDRLEATEVTLTLSGAGSLQRVDVGAPTAVRRGVGIVATPTHYDIYWGCVSARPTSGAACNGQVDGSVYHLSGGDRVLIAQGAVVDVGGLASRTVIERVDGSSAEPELMGSPTLSLPVSATDETGAARSATATFRADGRDLVSITAFPGGIAGGSAGNDWTFEVAYAPDDDAGFADDADALAADVSVSLNRPRRVIVATYDDEASVADIVAELQSALDVPGVFRVNQLARTQSDYTEPLAAAPDVGALSLTGGASEATLTLEFRHPLADFDLDAFVAGQPPDSPFRRSLRVTVQSEASGPGAFPARSIALTYVYESGALPSAADTVNLPRGVALDYRERTNSGRRNVEVTASAQQTPEPGT